MRLVPGQNWKEISALFSEHIKNITPKGVNSKVTEHHGGEPYVAPTNTVGFKAASNAYEDVFNLKPIPTRDGGSIPIIALFEKELDSKTILMGFGLDSDAIHSPNEHYGVSNFLMELKRYLNSIITLLDCLKLILRLTINNSEAIPSDKNFPVIVVIIELFSYFKMFESINFLHFSIK